MYWIGKKSEFSISPKNGSLNQSFVLHQELHLYVQKLYSQIRDGNKQRTYTWGCTNNNTTIILSNNSMDGKVSFNFKKYKPRK